MATQQDVRRIALSLDGTSEDPESFRFYVGERQFLWLWQERVDPKKARVPNPGVIAVRVADDIRKRMRLAMDPRVFFTEPHYDGYDAVLVRLAAIGRETLREVITESWEVMRSGSRAPRRRPAAGGQRGRQPRRPRA